MFSLVEIDNALFFPLRVPVQMAAMAAALSQFFLQSALSSKTRTCHTCHTYHTHSDHTFPLFCLLPPLFPLILNRLNYHFSSFSTLVTFLAQILIPSITASTSFHHLLLPLSALKQTRYMHHPSTPNINFLALTCTRSQAQHAQKQMDVT